MPKSVSSPPRDPLSGIAPADRPGAVRALAAAWGSTEGPRRLANLALRAALIRAWEPAAPPPPPVAAPPAPPPAPSLAPGKLRVVALEDLSRLLAPAAEDEAPSPPPLKVDFSMFGDDAAPAAPPEAEAPPAADPLPAAPRRKKAAGASNSRPAGRSRTRPPAAE